MKMKLAALSALMSASCFTSATAEELKPGVIKWGASAAEIEAALEGKCAEGFVNRPIDPPFLPNKPAKQVQIDCNGLDFMGAPRWTEFVIGDDRLQMVWVMVEAEDKAKVVAALKEHYGAPSHDTQMFIAFSEADAAWREEPPEVLFYSDEIAPMMEAWFDHPE
ncbi:hypothetical protein [Hyphococcus sp.]|uniref:hypothetical protein n=1 Tax=Hyphococcus sp. TaxID=2038636 RepID=UPI002083E499|nr:MAG: hypothetical protein DHS20C04_02900 [Marinicaulis sp.]